MLGQINQFIQQFGLGERAEVAVALAVISLLLALLATAAFFVAKRLLLKVAAAVVQRTKTDWDDRLLRHHVFFWLAHLAPGIVLFLLAPSALRGAGQLIAGVRGAAMIYMVVVVLLAFDSLLNAVLEIYSTFPVSKQVPLKSFVQVAKIVLYIAAIIVILATLLGKSPVFLLSGMGVLASVLMLVFKDPILGFVAGIQLSTNRMLSKGDWIAMPSHGADGDVIDIALTTVKVQNWDKTITTIPTHALISDSFKNWRGMSESGGRRIKRSVYIDMNTIRLCTPEMIERHSKILYIADYIETKQRELTAWNKERGVDDTNIVNGRRITNVGTFRAYILAYLKNHPKIHQEMTLLVRQLAPTSSGLPLEVYCFSADQDWEAYESIQADVFDHLLAVLPEFDLRIFQNPSGSDFRRLGA
ncbi:MAG: mechanosensitive ion channel family protein [bacterium]|nr:mechanosensitive ion channel family protein [bacterium]